MATIKPTNAPATAIQLDLHWVHHDEVHVKVWCPADPDHGMPVRQAITLHAPEIQQLLDALAARPT